MAELHAKEAPDRVWELEAWGAIFDRTKDGKISQRNFGGHEYPRLAHVGDRTGLEMIRTLQQKVVALQQEDAVNLGDPEAMIKVFAETTITRPGQGRRADRRARSATSGTPAGSCCSRRRRWCSPPAASARRSRSARTPGSTPATGTRSPCWPGPPLLNMEFVQFHPTTWSGRRRWTGCWSPSRSAATAACCATPRASATCSTTCPTCSGRSTRRPKRRRDRWYTDPDNNRRPPELLPRDEVARANNAEVKAGRGSPHGGVFLDIASRLPADEILRRLPSMYHQFKELADVDITKEPMEVGPTCHYVMGGVEVDPDTAAVRGARPVRGRRGVGRHARLQPARRQLPVRPAGVRPAGGAGRGGLRRQRWPARPAVDGRGARRRPAARRSPRWSGPTARTRTRSTASSSRR